jgi:hypothetical protein
MFSKVGFSFFFIKDAATIPHAKKMQERSVRSIDDNVLNKKRINGDSSFFEQKDYLLTLVVSVSFFFY